MRLEPNRKVKILVTHSECDFIEEGNTIFLNGPVMDPRSSSPMCVTALVAIYPWVLASRFGIRSETLEWDNGYRVWCPEKLVEFMISTISDDHVNKEPYM